MRTKFLATAVAILMALPAGAVAVPGLTPDAAETITAARAEAAAIATELLAQASEATDDASSEGEGRGQDPNKSTGLARAAEVSNSWRFNEEVDKPGNGNSNGRGMGSARSRAVHAALAAGTSPSEITEEDLEAAAAELAGAFNSFKSKRDGHPGKGQGKGLGGPGGPDAEDPTDD